MYSIKFLFNLLGVREETVRFGSNIFCVSEKKLSSVLKITVVSPIFRGKITVDSMLLVKIHLQRFNSVPIFSIAWNLGPIICGHLSTSCYLLYKIFMHILVLDIISDLYQLR